MKNPSATFKRLYLAGAPVYCKAIAQVYNKKYDRTDTVTLNPAKFRITGNSYTQNSDNNIPIGNVLCKSITLKISNQNNEWRDYDWNKASIELSSTIIDNETFYSVGEGQFYVDSAKFVQNAIEIIAYDMIAYTNFDMVIRNYVPPSGKEFEDVSDYFKYLCDDVLAPRLGITLATGHHLYTTGSIDAIDYSPSGYIGVKMAQIVPEYKPTTTLRDILGYIAQLACGNICVIYDAASTPHYKIDLSTLKIPHVGNNSIFYHAGNIEETIEDIYDAGTVDQQVTDRYIADNVTFTQYTLLEKFTAPPNVEYSDVEYTGVSIEYPVRDQSKNGVVSSIDSEDNVLKLYNPVLASDNSSTGEPPRQAIANKITNYLAYPFRPFEGTVLNNPLLEFGDSVIVMDGHGDFHPSYIGKHVYNYLSGSDISNNTKLLSQDFNTFYR